MEKYNPNSVYQNAFMRDSKNNEYTAEALFMALILKTATGGERTDEAERGVAELMDDQNLKE